MRMNFTSTKTTRHENASKEERGRRGGRRVGGSCSCALLFRCCSSLPALLIANCGLILFRSYYNARIILNSDSTSIQQESLLDVYSNNIHDIHSISSSSSSRGRKQSYGSFGISSNNNKELPSYVREHCNLTDVKEWMPSSSNRSQDEDWDIPSFFILGVKKAGTTGLFHTLTSHPQIFRGRTKELQYFIPKRFPHWQNGTVGNPVQVAAARDELYHKHFRRAVATTRIHPNAKIIAGEATPDYLMFPDYSAQAILCTVPWAKFIVILREPIERLFSHYNYLADPRYGNRRRDVMPPFEEWVRRDIQVLQNAGVLPRNLSDIPTYMGSQQERMGWINYQRMIRPGQVPGSDRQFVRSLYAPQLEAWNRHLKSVGKFWQQTVKVVLSQQLMQQNVTNDLMTWLGVELHNNHTIQPQRSMMTHYTSPPITPQFREWLHSTIFVHYNQRLYQFLGPQYYGIFDHKS